MKWAYDRWKLNSIESNDSAFYESTESNAYKVNESASTFNSKLTATEEQQQHQHSNENSIMLKNNTIELEKELM